MKSAIISQVIQELIARQVHDGLFPHLNAKWDKIMLDVNEEEETMDFKTYHNELTYIPEFAFNEDRDDDGPYFIFKRPNALRELTSFSFYLQDHAKTIDTCALDTDAILAKQIVEFLFPIKAIRKMGQDLARSIHDVQLFTEGVGDPEFFQKDYTFYVCYPEEIPYENWHENSVFAWMEKWFPLYCELRTNMKSFTPALYEKRVETHLRTYPPYDEQEQYDRIVSELRIDVYYHH